MLDLANEKVPALPIVDPAGPASAQNQSRTRTRRGLLAVAGLLTILAVSSFSCNADSYIPECLRSLVRQPALDIVCGLPVLDLPEKIQRRWGQYSPYYPAGEYVPPPVGCVIDQVNILHRHGARYPDHDDDYDVVVERLQTAKQLHDDLKFVKDYEYTLGEDDLLAFGAEQSFESGRLAYERYSQLLTTALPFIRASSMQRVVDTAGNWSEGFLPPRPLDDPHLPPNASFPIQIISEQYNDTLNEDCPNAPHESKYTNQWLHKFAPPIIHRIKKMAKGVKLEDEDVHRLVGVCIFETIADVSREMRGLQPNSSKSPFCDIFTPNDWKEWEYWGDVEKYYKTGYGNPLGPIRGVGYVNELLARLTQSEVVDHTQHNYSLPFPLNRSIYADFTHENLMVAVYSAMGLFNISKPLNPRKMPKDMDREWLASHMVPFSARMVVERLQCQAPYDAASAPEDTPANPHWSEELLADAQKHKTETGTFVRIFVNDAAQPLEFCNHNHAVHRPCSRWQRKHSLCTLDNFVESQRYARASGNGDFEKCYN
ncbi:histidine phosphatase family protein [Phanerochaete sordida]|uniref:Histidine phosphatase family protein n=1 Tax=Phanerochaete sordida TaxID=48140 RepID=A0A9P3FZ21_9APHY|nr:histidine phosphatase family protein [Phanerochaete sordida]